MYVVISIIISIPSRQYLVNSEDKLPSFYPEKSQSPMIYIMHLYKNIHLLQFQLYPRISTLFLSLF